MKYGKYTEEAQKVLDFFMTLNLNDSRQSESFELVKDFGIACELCFEDQIDNQYTTWRDVWGMEASRIRAFEYESKETKRVIDSINLVYDELEIFSIQLYEHYKATENPLIDFTDNILGDAEMCFLQVAYKGKLSGFFEKVYNGYKDGLIPCAWLGEYPEGKILFKTSTQASQ